MVERNVLTRQKLCCGLSIFKAALSKIRSFLDDPIWYGQTPANGVISTDDNREFHRFWSAIQFTYCVPVGENELSVE